MSALRTLQRNAIKAQCYKKYGHRHAFKDTWEAIHYGKEVDDDGNVTTKSKKVEKARQNHFDDGRTYSKYLKAAKAFVNNVKNNKNTTNAKEKVC